MADPGVGPAPSPPLSLDQTKTRRAEKKFLETVSSPPLSQGVDAPHPLPPLSEGLDPPLVNALFSGCCAKWMPANKNNNIK